MLHSTRLPHEGGTRQGSASRPDRRAAARRLAAPAACFAVLLALAAGGCSASRLGDKRLSLPGLGIMGNRPKASAAASALAENRGGQSAATPRIDAAQGRVDLMMAMAETHALHRRDHEAAKCYEEILTETPDQLEARHRLALSLDRLSDHKRATEQFERCLEQAPDHPDLLADMGYRDYLQGDLEKAEGHYRRGLQAHPRHERLSMNLGVLLAHTGRSDEAIDAFMNGGCSRTEAVSNVGHVHVLDDRLEEARPILLAAASAPDASDRAKSTVKKLWPGETVHALHEAKVGSREADTPDAQHADYEAADDATGKGEDKTIERASGETR